MIHLTSIDMRKYTANYTVSNPNFAIQNLVKTEVDFAEKPLLFVLKNILQRGFPTMMSQFLQSKIGAIHEKPDFRAPFLYIGTQTPQWINTIKGDPQNQYFPAKIFLEKLIPEYFGDFAFVQHLILPEAEINEIVGEHSSTFVNQRVDFFLPQAKLVIEIDGQQHKTDDLQRISDTQRDTYLWSKGIKTIRIATRELGIFQFQAKRSEILEHLSKSNGSLTLYQRAYEKKLKKTFNEKEIRTKLLPTAIIRFQILLIELLLNNYLNFKETWKFNLIVREEEHLGDFAKLALEDFFIWFSHLYRLQTKQEWNPPAYSIQSYSSRESCPAQSTVLNIDFSLFLRWTDEAALYPDAIFVRTDYYGVEKNYFQVSCAPAINYQITNEDKPTLEFFLLNLFGKLHFRDGQFPIIANILNREDTIGLLPTGGGKSLCYQLPCLLQPSVNFVVCPIKSLMYDQYENLKNAYITNTQFITSDQSAEEKERLQKEFANRKYLFVWISPERFQIKRFRAYLATINASASIAHAVIDEVHCLSEWGHDFRTSYLNLAKTVEKYCPQAKFVGLTATASVNVLKDIRAEFARNNRIMRDENIKSLLDYSREELTFQVIKDNNQKLDRLKTLLNQEGVLEQKQKTALVFTPHVNGQYGCFDLANQLNQGLGVAKWYAGEVPQREIHGGDKVPVMPLDNFNQYKKDVQLDFKNDQFPLLVATKAFGMGIDKQNIHYTFHYGIPSSVEALYQEAGRAGRWDHRMPGMNKVKAHCYVLYSPETVNQAIVNRLFDKDTSFTELKAILEDVKWDGKDVFRQIFLFMQGQLDPAGEYKIIQLILRNYFVAHSTQRIDFNTVSNELRGLGFAGSNDSLCKLTQKAIYRLSVLGIASDWTTDFTNHYEVEFRSMEDHEVFQALEHYLIKYQPDIKLSEELSKINRPSWRDRCIWYLLQWTFDNIIYSRKQTLKTLAEWCNDFEEIGNEAFKQRIDNYFRFTDTVFLFQFIAENPAVFAKWFEVFYRVDRDIEQQEEAKTYIPTISNPPARQAEFERLRDSLSRFLESYRNSTGLNLISGLIRLYLNDYENTDGRPRFESALNALQTSFDQLDQQSVLRKIANLGRYLDESAQEQLYASVIRFYPEQAEALAEHLGLIYLLDDRISRKIHQFKTLNNRLHAEFEQIGKI